MRAKAASALVSKPGAQAARASVVAGGSFLAERGPSRICRPRCVRADTGLRGPLPGSGGSSADACASVGDGRGARARPRLERRPKGGQAGAGRGRQLGGSAQDPAHAYHASRGWPAAPGPELGVYNLDAGRRGR